MNFQRGSYMTSTVDNTVTIRTVATEAGVSVSTVSRFLNHPEIVIKETQDRIREAIRRTGFVPNIAASGLKTGSSKMQILLVPDICNPFYSQMAKHLQRLSHENGSILMVFDTGEEIEQELAGISLAKQVSASGIYVASVFSEEKVIRELAELNAVVVGINSYSPGVPFDAVGVHHLGGTNLAVNHLAELGHTEIAFAGGKPDSIIGESRKKGCEYAMKKANLEIREEWICEEGFSEKDGYRAAHKIMEGGRMPTAICCANDLVAFGVIRALTEMGFSVPDAISVTGMDDTPFAATAQPELTSVTNDGILFAEQAFLMMKSRTENSYSGTPRFTEIPNQLSIRKSTAVPRTKRNY